MKKLFSILAICALALTSCNKPDDEPKPLVKEPVLTLTSEATMSFPAEGGEGAISYTLENGVEGTAVVATCDAEWIGDLTVAETITFSVTANETEARETKVVVTYDDKSFEVAVKQAAKSEEPKPELKEAHTIAIDQITWRDAIIEITPENEGLEYIAGIYHRATYDERFGEDKDAIIDYRVKGWQETAKQYEDYGYDDPWQFYMQNEQHSGTTPIAASELENLTWGEKYVVYCFGMDDDGNATSAVTIAEFETLSPESSDNSFTITVDATIETSITFTIATTNEDPYFVSLQQTGYTDSYGPDTDQPYEMMIADLAGTYPDNVLHEKYIFNGTRQFTSDEFLQSVNSMREYKVIVCGFQNGPTTEVMLSDAIKPEAAPVEEPLALTLEISDVTATTIAVDVTASDTFHTYYGGLHPNIQTSEVDALVETILSSSDISDHLYTGSQSLLFEGLEAATTYTFVAFAYDASTDSVGDIVMSDITTAEPPVDNSAFTLDITDITWHNATLGVTPVDGSATYIAGILSKGDYETKCGSTPENIAELRLSEWKEIAEMYQDWGYNDPWQYYMRSELKSGTRTFAGSQLCLMRWASDYVAYCFGMDNDGNLTTEVVVKEYTTLAPTPSSNTFAITIDSTTSSSVSFTVETTNSDRYYVSVQQQSYVNGYGEDKDESYEDMIFNLTGEYADYIIEQSMYSGTQSITISNLRGGSKYQVIVCGFDNGPSTDIYLSEVFTAKN